MIIDLIEVVAYKIKSLNQGFYPVFLSGIFCFA